LAALKYRGSNKDEFIRFVLNKIDLISATRPTAVNLFWSMKKMRKVISDNKNLSIDKIREKLIKEAGLIERQDYAINRRIGENGAKIFVKSKKKLKIFTHCNAGALATSGYGTALGVIRSLHEYGKVANVIVDETRPYLQGARLTAWELYQEGISFFIVTDNMSGYFMARGEVDIVIVGADRVAANGDTANKIGTLSLSILAKYYKIPFYIAAPVSTIDLQTKSGKDIPIEYRGADEIRTIFGEKIIPDYMPVSNPAFDVTPNENIKTAIITEKGVIYSPCRKNIKKLFIDFKISS
ncbi:MAG: S-methyl-5-thioribose-1-phosphate isomerase, partial [Actinobacteria bacterium]|nr:S-methyl-5-thioribose-1-phosphate isomerase [Actinomycetota bacterium]